MKGHDVATLSRGVVERQGAYSVDFLSRGEPVSISTHAEPSESSPYNHHLHQFLTFLKRERGFADATIVNRVRSLKPFLGWLVAQDVPLSTVSPGVITKYFTSAVAGRWKRTTISFHVYSLRSFFRFATNRGWCATSIAESIDAPTQKVDKMKLRVKCYAHREAQIKPTRRSP
jgi:Phage integrase, N-terminal SAM-like domain